MTIACKLIRMPRGERWRRARYGYGGKEVKTRRWLKVVMV
jgi:hypothetical protein